MKEVIILGTVICVFLLIRKANKKKISPPPYIMKTVKQEPPKDIMTSINTINHVYDNIYISGWGPSTNEEELKKYNIKYILCLNKENKKDVNTMNLYQKLGISHMYVEIYDDPSAQINKVFKACYDFIKSANGQNVLIHCTAGISRSATIVTMYLMNLLNKPKEEVYKLLKSKRPIVNINPGFWNQL